MPAFGPISRVELIQCFRRPGFAGPFSGGKHQFMIRGDFTIRVPDPHHGDMTRKPSGGRLRYTSSTSEIRCTGVISANESGRSQTRNLPLLLHCVVSVIFAGS